MCCLVIENGRADAEILAKDYAKFLTHYSNVLLLYITSTKILRLNYTTKLPPVVKAMNKLSHELHLISCI